MRIFFLIIFILFISTISKAKEIENMFTNHEDKFDCKETNDSDEINFMNLKFGENISQVYCRLIKKLKPDNYQFSLFGYQDDGYFPEQDGIGDFVVDRDLSKDKNANFIGEFLYANHCSIKQEEIQYWGSGNYHGKIKDLSKSGSPSQRGFENTELGDLSVSQIYPYSIMIYPINLSGINFNLQLKFESDPGVLLYDDLTLNVNDTLSLNICKKPYDGSGFKEVFFPLTFHEVLLYSDEKIDKNFNKEVFDHILNKLNSKYAMKSGIPRGFSSTSSCHGETFFAQNEISMIKACYKDNYPSIMISYSLSNSYFKNSDQKVSKLLENERKKILNTKSENDSSSDL